MTTNQMYKKINDQINDKKVIAYARTVTRRNQYDIDQQCKILKETYPNAEIVCDYADGNNYNRTGLSYIIKNLKNYKIKKIIAMTEDTIIKKDYKLFKKFCKMYDCKLVIHNSSKSFFNFRYFY